MHPENRIGIITFHAAHNYGSVLQAYATQKLITEMGYANEIINYRLKNQMEFYNHLYSTQFGLKAFLQRVMRIIEHRKRTNRADKFETFIYGRLQLSSKEYSNYEQLKASYPKYDVLISGSDQIWNEHCTAEFQTEPPESILGYYLAFVDETVPKIAFSSSFGGMKPDEIEKYKEYLSQYRYLSVREEDGARMLSELLDGRNIENTLDPTLLFNGAFWNSLSNQKQHTERYILIYTLRQYHAAKELMDPVLKMARRFGLKVKCISPFSIVLNRHIESVNDSGPEDFLALIRDAALVITDSFHGTAFSINMGTPFYVIENRNKDKRKSLLLKKLGLQNRIISSYTELDAVADYRCDYTEPYQLLEQERDKSIFFLRTSLQEIYADGNHL